MSKHRGGGGNNSGKGGNDWNRGDDNEEDDYGREKEETPQERRLRERVEADKQRQAEAHVIKSRQSVIRQLNSPTPEIYALSYSIGEVEKAEGSEGYFIKDTLFDQSIQEAMTANQNRPEAADAVHILSRRLQEIIHQENVRDQRRNAARRAGGHGGEQSGGMGR